MGSDLAIFRSSGIGQMDVLSSVGMIAAATIIQQIDVEPLITTAVDTLTWVASSVDNIFTRVLNYVLPPVVRSENDVRINARIADEEASIKHIVHVKVVPVSDSETRDKVLTLSPDSVVKIGLVEDMVLTMHSLDNSSYSVVEIVPVFDSETGDMWLTLSSDSVVSVEMTYDDDNASRVKASPSDTQKVDRTCPKVDSFAAPLLNKPIADQVADQAVHPFVYTLPPNLFP